MAISATPNDFSNDITGRLTAAITSSATSGIKVTADNLQIGSRAAAAVTWPTGDQVLKLSRTVRNKKIVEYIGVESGTTQSGATVTLGTTIRDLSTTDGTDLTTQSNGVAWPAGSKVELVWGVHHAEQVPYKDVANTFSANQTISGTNELRFADSATAIWDDGTTLRFKSSSQGSVTLDTLAATGGSDEKVGIDAGATAGYLGAASNDGVLRTVDGLSYTDGGDFVTLDVTFLKDAAETELTISSGSVTATNSAHSIDTESDAATDDLDTISGGASGDYITIRPNNTARSVVVKNATGNLLTKDDQDFTMDTIDKSITLRFDGSNWKEVARSGNSVDRLAGATADSSTVGASSTAEANLDVNATIAANTLAVGDYICVKASGQFDLNSSNLTLRLKAGSTEIVRFLTDAAADGPFAIDAWVAVRAVGASGSLMGAGLANFKDQDLEAGRNSSDVHPSAVTVDTTSAITLQLSAQFGASDAAHDCTLKTLLVSVVKAP